MPTYHRGAEYVESLEKIYRRYAEEAKSVKQRAKYVAWADKCAMSPLGREVADILGQVFLGLYHIEESVSDGKADWSNRQYIEISLRGSVSTYDSAQLTWLVILCHDRAIRLAISGSTHNRLLLIFHMRTRGGGVSQRHPFMTEAIDHARGNLGLDVTDRTEFPE